MTDQHESHASYAAIRDYIRSRRPDGLVLRMHTRELHEWDMATSDLHSAWARPLPRDDWKGIARA